MAATKIGRYEVEHKIGEGAFGVVYKARDPVLDRAVAIKVPSLTLNDDELASLIMEFYREARIGAQFRHSNIVTVYDLGVNEHSENIKMHYLVMEYVSGMELKDYLKQVEKIEYKEVLKIMFECCKALDYIHFHKIVHRDIKLGNIMYNPSYSTVKLMDFGIADQLDVKAAKGVGTLFYMSPEHFDDSKELTFQTDIFALGSVMYQLITGKPAFQGKDIDAVIQNIQTKEPIPIQHYRPDAPPELSDLVNKALAKNPADRYESSLAFASAIQKLLDTLSVPTSESDEVDAEESGKIQQNDDYVFLRDNSWFKDFSPSLIEELVKVGRVETYAANELIVTEGEIADSFYTIISGAAEVVKSSSVVARMKAGDSFGELGHVTANARRTASIRTTELTKVLNVGIDTLEMLSPENQAMLYKGFLKTTMERMTALQESMNACDV
ncbi:MAG: serine/threonine-protein kinase [Gammaproteobacteria bacterium]|nr:serine/threonine-protein kinase [Gammaproteobacteria bacterium]